MLAPCICSCQLCLFLVGTMAEARVWCPLLTSITPPVDPGTIYQNNLTHTCMSALSHHITVHPYFQHAEQACVLFCMLHPAPVLASVLQVVNIRWPYADSAYLCVVCSKGAPAYCIVMSGGYRDDVDAGLEVQYTGEGGQSKGKHVCFRAN